MKRPLFCVALCAILLSVPEEVRAESPIRPATEGPVRFLLMSDTHVESDYLERGRPVYTCWKPGDHRGLTATYEFVNTNEACRDLRFALFCGDQINTGYLSQPKDLNDEMENYRRTLRTLDLFRLSKDLDLTSFDFRARPYVCRQNIDKRQPPLTVEPPPLGSRVIAIQGNHDTGCPVFYRDCSFRCGDVRFIAFFASYVGLPAPKGQYRSTAKIADETVAFIEREMTSAAADPTIRHIVLVSHWGIVADDPKNFHCPIRDAMKENGFNDNRRKVLALAEKYGCDLFINGHEHNSRWPVGRVGSLSDINCGAVADRGTFAVVEIQSDKAVFTVYSTAVAEEKDGGCLIVKAPRRLFDREITLKPLR